MPSLAMLSRSLARNVRPPGPNWSSQAINLGTIAVRTAYNNQVTATSTVTLTYSKIGGPTWLNVSASGLLTGTSQWVVPGSITTSTTQTVTPAITIRAQDQTGQSADITFTLTLTSVRPTWSISSMLGNFATSTSYSVSVQGTSDATINYSNYQPSNVPFAYWGAGINGISSTGFISLYTGVACDRPGFQWGARAVDADNQYNDQVFRLNTYGSYRLYAYNNDTTLTIITNYAACYFRFYGNGSLIQEVYLAGGQYNHTASLTLSSYSTIDMYLLTASPFVEVARMCPKYNGVIIY